MTHAGEDVGTIGYAFDDGGQKPCGCSGRSVACAVASANLVPPEPLD